MAQITVENLTLGYDNRIVLKDLNFSLNSGEYLCVVGENGSGKSTLMKAILGLNSQKSGKIIFGDNLKNNEIGYLPQQTNAQKDFPATVQEIVLSGFVGKSGPFYSKCQKQTADNIMEKLGISKIKKTCYRELSGGQQQRVLLCRALCATKKILLLDEPVSGLDPVASSELYDIIYNLNKNEKITVIMISHDIPATLKYATHILHLGKEVFFGTKEKYLKSEQGKIFSERCAE